MPEVGVKDAIDVLVRRRAILDRTARLVGYEVIASDSAQVLRTVLDLGIEQFSGGHRAFLTLPDQFNDDGLRDVLDPSRCVIVVPTGSTSAPTVATDFEVLVDGVRAPDWATLVRMTVDAHGERTTSVIADLHSRGVQVIADGVDTQEEFRRGLGAGFDLFCGQWFKEPASTEATDVPANRLNVLRLLALVCDEDADVDELESLVSQDVGLSYRLVRTVNSPAIGARARIESIGQAMMMLGMKRLRTWVQMVSLANVEGKASELMTIAMIRAGMCERLGVRVAHPAPDSLFTVGLFSVLDALLDLPMELILEEIGLSDEINHALIDRTGNAGSVLRCVLAHERGVWEDVDIGHLDVADIMKAYLESVIWADETMALMDGVA